VTLHINRGGQSELRGCIGTLSPTELSKGLGRFALQSAFGDSRFRPLALDELPHIELSVSLLVRYEQGSNYLDWQVGTHGIIIEFKTNDRAYSATYLPEVAPEQGWTQTDAVTSLIRKAGFKAEITQEILTGIKLTRYQSSKAKLSYIQFCAFSH